MLIFSIPHSIHRRKWIFEYRVYPLIVPLATLAGVVVACSTRKLFTFFLEGYVWSPQLGGIRLR